VKAYHQYLALLACLLLAAFATARVSAEEKLTISGDSARSVKQTDSARETQLTGATATQDGMRLRADRMLVQSKDNLHTLVATGSARLQDAVSVITGDTITVNTGENLMEAAGHAVLEMTAKVPEGKTEAAKLTFTADNISYDYANRKARLAGHVTLKTADITATFGDAIVEYDWQESKLTVRSTAVNEQK
jgi:lipopolysaccharide export system protein LptA